MASNVIGIGGRNGVVMKLAMNVCAARLDDEVAPAVFVELVEKLIEAVRKEERNGE